MTNDERKFWFVVVKWQRGEWTNIPMTLEDYKERKDEYDIKILVDGKVV
jgi:hypothetical protein